MPPAARNSHMHTQVWRLAWPMILSNLSIPLLGIVDTAILGHLDSASYIGVVAIGASILTFLFWAFGFLRMATTSLTAQAFGAGNQQYCRQILAQSLVLAALLALTLVILQIIIFPLALLLMAPSSEAAPHILSYCQIRIVAAPATLINYAIVGWFIGLQNTRVPLLIMLTTNLLNIAFDFLLILGLGLNSDGAALATVIAEYLGLGLGLGLVVRRLNQMQGSVNRPQLLRLSHYRSLLQSNRHLFVRTASLLFAFAFFTRAGAQQGEIILAANAIILQLLLLTSYGLDGFAHAAEALTGKTIGQGQVSKFMLACRTTTYWALITSLVFCLFFLALRQPLIYLFTDIIDVRAAVEQYYTWLYYLPLIGIWCYQLDGIFIGAGKTRAMQNSMLIACLLIFLPSYYLLQPLGNHGLWAAFSLFLASRGLLLGHIFYRYSRDRCWIKPH